MPWMLKKLSTWTWHYRQIDVLFRLWWIWRLPLQQLLLSLWIVTINPWFTTDYIEDKGVVISSLLLEFHADRHTMVLLGHCSAILTQILQKCLSFSNCLTKWVEWLCVTVLLSHKHRDPTICKDSLTNVCYVFQWCTCQRSSLAKTHTVINRHPSILEVFVPYKHVALGQALSPEASFSICGFL